MCMCVLQWLTIFFSSLSSSISGSLAHPTSGPILSGPSSFWVLLPFTLTMKQRATKGFENLVVIYGNRLPVELLMKEKWTRRDLQRRFHNARVFVRNKNLQSLERSLQGAILWVPYLKKIVVVLKAYGCKAYVLQIYPPLQPHGVQCFKMSMLLSGFFLEQIHGKSIVDHYHSPKILHTRNSSSSYVVPLLDDDKYIKMNIHGPDIALVTIYNAFDHKCPTKLGIVQVIPNSVLDWLHEDTWTSLTTDPIYQPLEPLGSDQQPNPQSVDVIYILATGPANFKRTSTDGVQGLIGVPIGDPKEHRLENSR